MGGQLCLLAATFLWGLVVGGAFELQARLTRRWGRRARSAADFVLWALLAGGTFGLLWHLAAGEVRFFAFLGMGLGWWAYRRWLAGRWWPGGRKPPPP